MALKVYNTLARKKQEFEPLTPGKVGMYVCGITPYGASHIGHARSGVAFDVVVRWLEFRGFDVTKIVNFTDMDDKIINKANETGEEPAALARRIIKEYFEEFDELGVKRATHYPLMTEHIPEIIGLVKTLVAKGFAYEVEGEFGSGKDVFFEVAKFKDYGKLSGQPLEQLVAGARVEVDERKKSAADFALWKSAKPGEPFWESPWGKGRPGWHVECSAMSMKYLGETLDIHGGGHDLVFPHHEDEIAQSEAATGKQFARYWIHNGFVIVGKEKMAKSLGNFVTLREALDKWGAPVLRYFLLTKHYRDPLDADPKKVEEAAASYQKLADTVKQLEEAAAEEEKRSIKSLSGEERELEEIKRIEEKFGEAMDDDFNTPAAIAALFELKDLGQKCIADNFCSHISATNLLASFRRLGKVLGLFQVEGPGAKDRKMKISEKEIGEMIAAREAARKTKNFVEADRIRKLLLEKGIILEDSAGGAKWKKKA